MNIGTLLGPDRVRCAAEATSKKRTLELVSELLTGDEADPKTRTIFESLIGRERLGSTGLGKGVALPHARVADLDRPLAALVTLSTPVDFDAIDREPVDVLFALLVPEQSTDEHLRILAALAEMFSDKDLCDALRRSSTAQEAIDRIEQWTGRTGAK